MFRQFAPGLLARVNYQADTAGAYRVALWDFLVGPGKRMEAPVALPGGGVFEVRSGTGRIEIDGIARDLRGGATFVVHQGSRFALSNGRDDIALALRVTLISPASR
jgi:mannose-6-phosphate isomerase-like protein (cupin superfamily)